MKYDQASGTMFIFEVTGKNYLEIATRGTNKVKRLFGKDMGKDIGYQREHWDY